MWVKVKKDYDYWRKPRSLLAFKAGTDVLVKANIGQDLIEAGVAEEIESPRREAAGVAKETGKLPEPEDA